MRICPACAHENADDARFCSQCATPLAQETAREERKVVTCLFCDLVGFTAKAEQLDPEDVRRVLQPYHARVRAELERHGGTVEKFIGDAVMAVFGAPVAHEDDPERAVRAALAIREALAEEGELEVRIGITTGEALIALGARPEAGEGMASGDVVNTAARLQSAAPVNGILVDETTYRATERVIRYDEAGSVEAKGKSEPVPVWAAVEAKARFGVDVRQLGAAGLVGRRAEVDALLATLERVTREGEPQLVTLVGVPGIGKSRLVWELFQRVDEEPELTHWRQGRSLPYGEGVSFWALGEMVKAQAGVLETDDAARTGEKLRETVGVLVVDDADARWLESHLRPLVGLESTDGVGAGGRRDEAFAAWRRFLEALAEDRRLVLVFEDLHWADDALLDFVDYLVEWASGVPLLVVGTARPELLTRRPGWGGGKPNALTLSLSPLSDEDTAQLVHALLGQPVLDAGVQEMLLERAGGNPLYAEEFVRALEGRADGETALPETVQGLIAARLDALSSEEKSLLQAAAVFGKVFWLGASSQVAAIPRWTAETVLHALERKEFVRRERRSSVAGEAEYAFRHLLVRDVAYGQIPRGARADLHRGAARWIESLGRPEDHAEMLAHHYLRALELARSTDQPTNDIADAARRAFREAGDRSLSLSSYASAVRFYDEALELGFDERADDAVVRFARARALFLQGSPELEAALEEAREALLAAGAVGRAAEADALLAELWWHRGDGTRSLEHLNRARELVEGLPASAAKAHVLSGVSRHHMLAGRFEIAIEVGREAIAMSEELDLEEVHAHALNNVGMARRLRGDPTDLHEVERGIEIALAARSPEAARGLNNLGASLWQQGDFRRGLDLIREAVAVGDRLGNSMVRSYSQALSDIALALAGEWDECLKRMDAFIAACEAGEPHYLESNARLVRAEIRTGRGDSGGAVEDLRKGLSAARTAGDPQTVIPALAGAARWLAVAGDLDAARAYAQEALAEPTVPWMLYDLGWVANELDCGDALARQIEAPGQPSRWRDLMAMLLAHDYVGAADLLAETGVVSHEAEARVRAARSFLAEGRRTEADEQLQRALTFFRLVGATRYIRQAEQLLAAAS